MLEAILHAIWEISLYPISQQINECSPNKLVHYHLCTHTWRLIGLHIVCKSPCAFETARRMKLNTIASEYNLDMIHMKGK